MPSLQVELVRICSEQAKLKEAAKAVRHFSLQEASSKELTPCIQLLHFQDADLALDMEESRVPVHGPACVVNYKLIHMCAWCWPAEMFCRGQLYTQAGSGWIVCFDSNIMCS